MHGHRATFPEVSFSLYTKHLWPESRRPRGSEFLHPVNEAVVAWACVGDGMHGRPLLYSEWGPRKSRC